MRYLWTSRAFSGWCGISDASYDDDDDDDDDDDGGGGGGDDDDDDGGGGGGGGDGDDDDDENSGGGDDDDDALLKLSRDIFYLFLRNYFYCHLHIFTPNYASVIS